VPEVPKGILTALAEEAHTPLSDVVATVPATIARDQPQQGCTACDDDVVVVT
jgi:putative heme iron utilization protein